MGRRKSATFTEVELEFMQVIWAAGDAGSRESGGGVSGGGGGEVSTEHVQEVLKERGRNLTDGSIRKILSILMDKGHLTRRREGRAFLYKPKVRQGQSHRTMVQDLVKRAFGGSAGLMVAALFDGNALNKRDLKEIKRLIAEQEQEEDR